MADFFLSYARVDHEWVSKLAAALAERGLTVWRDLDIKPSARYRQVTARELATAHAVIVVWSKASVLSDWVLDEAEEGRRHDKLVQVIMDGTDMPFGFRQIQAVDLSNWRPGWPAAEMDRLAAGLSAMRPRDPSPDYDPRQRVYITPSAPPMPETIPILRDHVAYAPAVAVAVAETAMRANPQSPTLHRAPVTASPPQLSFSKIMRNFTDTVKKHYADFDGRVGQQQFWFYFLVWLVVLIIAGIIGVFSGFWLLEDVVGLALVVPSGGMAARRIQDSGNNGQLAWIWVGATALRYALGLYLSLSFFSYGFGFAGFTGYWLISGLVNLVALAATIMIIYFGTQKGREGPNQYGPPPAPWTSN